MRVTADNGGSNAVDLYNSASGTWSTAQLSVARFHLAATSVGNVAIFAGGNGGNCSFCVVLRRVCDGVVVRGLCVFETCVCCCFVVYAVQEVAVS